MVLNRNYQKCLLTGGNGLLGSNLIPLFEFKMIELLKPSSCELDITNANQVCEFFSLNPDIDLVVHCAAYTDVKKAESDYVKCNEINVVGTYNIFKECVRKKIKLVFISTDAVFDGDKGQYSPKESLNPISKYAKSKTAAELIVRTYDNSLVIRTSFFGNNFPYDKAFVDQWTTKDYIDIIAPKVFAEVIMRKTGISHIKSKRRTLYDLAKIRKSDVIASELHNYDYGFKLPFDLSLKEK
jgi:dTDP-4-dehydrorhamnose reductase